MHTILILINVYAVPLHNIAYSYMYTELLKKQLKLLLLSAVTATFQLQERKRFASWNHRISHPYTPVWNVVCVMIQAAVPQTGIKQMRTTNPTFHDWKRLLGKEIKSKTRVNHKKEEEKKTGHRDDNRHIKMALGELWEMPVEVWERGSCNRKGTELKTPITLLVKMLYPECSVPTLAQTWLIFTRLKWAIFSECPTCVCSFALKTSNCKTENTLQRSRAILTHNRNSQLRNRANILLQHAIHVAVHSRSL